MFYPIVSPLSEKVNYNIVEIKGAIFGYIITQPKDIIIFFLFGKNLHLICSALKIRPFFQKKGSGQNEEDAAP